MGDEGGSQGESFGLGRLIEDNRDRRRWLHEHYLNRQLPRVLRAIDFDRDYVRGERAYLYDRAGNRYLDMLAGFGVFALGRHHPVVRSALREALELALPDLVQMDAPILPGLLAERVLAHAPGLERVYFCNSGTEAVEAALKFARRATGRARVLYCEHAYHGLTAGSLSVNGAAEFRRGFGPLLPGAAVPLGDLDALRRELRRGGVAALIVEPVQGKGVYRPPPGYLGAARSLLHEYGALLICDEVQTGVGRTGRFFAYQHETVQPDLVTAAKALSGGFVPVGALLGRDWVFERVYSSMDRVFVHASTFAGNALAMAAGLATLQVIDDQGLVEQADRQGAQLRRELEELAGEHELLAEVRGCGLMIGLEFGPPRRLRDRAGWAALRAARRGLFTQTVVAALFQRHRVLTQVAGDHLEVIKLIPPLLFGELERKEFLDALSQTLDAAGRGTGLARSFGGNLIRHALTR